LPTDKYASDIVNKLNDERPETACLIGKGGAESIVSDWISTGSFPLDIKISNKIDGGIPVGRLTEISGNESAGKTLLCYNIVKETQKKGGLAVLIDTEHTASIETMKQAGIDVDNLVYVQPICIEDVFRTIKDIFDYVVSEKKNTDKLVTIIWDSIASTPSRAELEGDPEQKFYAAQALVISQGMRMIVPFIGKYKVCLVFVNQLRQKMGVTYGDNQVTPGGKSVPFYASVRIRLTKYGNIKGKGTASEPVGQTVKAKVTKNKTAPPYRTAEFNIMWDKGTGAYVDDPAGWLELAKSIGIVTVSGGWNSLHLNGKDKPMKFQGINAWSELLANTEIHEYVRGEIDRKLIIRGDE